LLESPLENKKTTKKSREASLGDPKFVADDAIARDGNELDA